MSERYCSIYDFGILPYALGDVLTWCVQSAIAAERAGRGPVDIFLCQDPRYPASIYQGELISEKNAGLHFNELYPAFFTHPNLGNVFLYSDRDVMIEDLEARLKGDPVNKEVLDDYKKAVAGFDNNDVLTEYFFKYIYYHKGINEFYERNGRIPYLQPCPGHGPDVDALIEEVFAGKYIVPFHCRQRKLDLGYRGEHTYSRDSDFVEWAGFFDRAEREFPNVQFVALGRLQEKPLDFLARDNVTSLRLLGLGLGHELTLMLRSNLFIGTSSGFAACANFSALPYFVTRMNKESCNAYMIPEGAKSLPFAAGLQELVYRDETEGFLIELLERGLEGQAPQPGTASASPAEAPPQNGEEDEALMSVADWREERMARVHSGASTNRFFVDRRYRGYETRFLLVRKIEVAHQRLDQGRYWGARKLDAQLRRVFPVDCERMQEYASFRQRLDGYGVADAISSASHELMWHVRYYAGRIASKLLRRLKG